MTNQAVSPQHYVGQFTIEVFGSGRSGRTCKTRFQLRCDGIGLHDNEILLLSVTGSETSIKALTAGLRSSTRDQMVIGIEIRSTSASNPGPRAGS